MAGINGLNQTELNVLQIIRELECASIQDICEGLNQPKAGELRPTLRKLCKRQIIGREKKAKEEFYYPMNFTTGDKKHRGILGRMLGGAFQEAIASPEYGYSEIQLDELAQFVSEEHSKS